MPSVLLHQIRALLGPLLLQPSWLEEGEVCVGGARGEVLWEGAEEELGEETAVGAVVLVKLTVLVAPGGEVEG